MSLDVLEGIKATFGLIIFGPFLTYFILLLPSPFLLGCFASWTVQSVSNTNQIWTFTHIFCRTIVFMMQLFCRKLENVRSNRIFLLGLVAFMNVICIVNVATKLNRNYKPSSQSNDNALPKFVAKPKDPNKGVYHRRRLVDTGFGDIDAPNKHIEEGADGDSDYEGDHGTDNEIKRGLLRRKSSRWVIFFSKSVYQLLFFRKEICEVGLGKLKYGGIERKIWHSTLFLLHFKVLRIQ